VVEILARKAIVTHKYQSPFQNRHRPTGMSVHCLRMEVLQKMRTIQRVGFDILKMRSISLTSPKTAMPRPSFGMGDAIISWGTRE
jgi:hypothetical protein